MNEYFEKNYTLGNPSNISMIRVGSSNSTNQQFGLDNFTIYTAPENLSSYKEIGSISKALLMKVGAENAMINGVQTELSYTPMLINNEVYCPVDVVESYTSTTCPEQYVVDIDGLDYIHIDNVKLAFGVIAKRYDMGLIIIGDEKSVLPDTATYEDIMTVMKTFVFNLPSANEFKEDVREYTNNFEHPYILANADKFDELRTIYTRGVSGKLTDSEELALYNYISSYIASAEYYLKTCTGLSKSTDNYPGLLASKIPVNANYTNYNKNGYDIGGRVNSIPINYLYYWAFAYQITGNLNYARATYDWSLALGDWGHWGPDHFLNCADAAAPFSIAYDWLYNAYTELNAMGEVSPYNNEVISTQKMVEIIFTHAILPGYVQSNGLACPWPGGANSRYSTKTNNWNAVCTSGMVAAALAIIGEDTSTADLTVITQKLSNNKYVNVPLPVNQVGSTAIHAGLDTYSDYAAKLATMNMNSLMVYGLEEYAPDGSYVESPGYWNYGTNTFFRMVACLETATGDDYGFMDSWGMDTTCYFAIHSESSDYKTWNFNDGSVGAQDTSYFFFVGNFYDDDNLIKVRKKHITTGKSYSLLDILYYDTTVTGEPDLATEYAMIGIDAFAIRSSWDKGAIYAGIMGGTNKVSHAHMDAGTFVYHNNGKIWFTDLGTDNYNISYYNKNGVKKSYYSNYELYRIGAEGHNIITITSEQKTLPYGQLDTANPPLSEYYSDVNGGYAVVDLSDSYGSHVISAKRGLLFTNSRNTVVIQDEITFNGSKTAYWFGHYKIASGYVDEVLISSDGKTAFMISGSDILRVTIVSDNDDLTFEIMDCYTYLLDITKRTDLTNVDTPTDEYNRDNFGKLAIKCENVTNLNLAVVIESVSSYQLGTSYTWTDIDSWTINSENNYESETNFNTNFDNNADNVGSASFNNTSNLYDYEIYEASSGSYANIYSATTGTASTNTSYNFRFAKNKQINLASVKYVAFSLDLFTESKFIDNSAIGFNVISEDNGEEFFPIVWFTESGITVNGNNVSLDGNWNKITVIVDGISRKAYVYVGTTFKGEVQNVPANILSASFTILSGSQSDKASSMLLDNVSVKTYGSLYDDETLSAILTLNTSLSSWGEYKETQTHDAPLAITNGNYLYTSKQIEAAIAQGKSVEILRDVKARVSVTNEASVNTNGYEFGCISDTHLANVNGNDITFETGSIKVAWHIGLGVVRETYSSSTIATFKQSDKNIGVIREEIIEYPDGTIGFKYYTTGWAASKNGKLLSEDEMVVTTENCEFWLVNTKPIQTGFVIEDANGNFKTYNSSSTLQNELSNNTKAKKVVLCSDFELTNTGAIAIASEGKNLYLNGYTLSHSVYDVHTFTLRYGATGNFNIYGHGTIKATDNRTIFTSAAETTGGSTKAGFVVTNVDIYTNSQLADLRIGTHEFNNCYIYQNATKNVPLVDLWNKNANKTNGVPNNKLVVSFNDSTIVKEGYASAALFKFAGNNNAEYRVNNTLITADCLLVNTSNPYDTVVISGNSKVFVKNLLVSGSIINNLLFDNGVKTNIEIPSSYIPNGALVADNQNDTLPYCIATDYATVKWLALDGKTVVAQTTLPVGSVPRLNSDVVAYLASINKDGNNYTYNNSVISVSGNIDLIPTQHSSNTILYGMNISSDFALEIYIPADELENNIQKVTLDGVVLKRNAYEKVTLNGVESYKHRIAGIDISDALTEMYILIDYNNGTTNELTVSVIEYLEDLLVMSTEEAVLAYKIVKYICCACDYLDNTQNSQYYYLNALLNSYSQYNLIYGYSESDILDTSDMQHAISTASLRLSASVRFRFVLKEDYTGTLTVNYLGKNQTYVVRNGLHNGMNYIEVELTASELTADLTISDKTGSIVYNIGSYFAALDTSDQTIPPLVSAIYEYSAAAKKYSQK